MTTADVAFFLAGVFMLLSLLGSTVVRRRVVSPELQAELFATPNRMLGTPDAAGLLRVRYFFPWSTLPAGVEELDSASQLMLAVARYCGLGFLLSIAAFFALVVHSAA